MAVSKTARAGIREICDASEVPWTDKKIDERIRAFRADARDVEPGVSPEGLAEIITFTSGTVLASVYGQSNVEEVARKIYEVSLPLHTKRHLTGDKEVDWSFVSSAILLLMRSSPGPSSMTTFCSGSTSSGSGIASGRLMRPGIRDSSPPLGSSGMSSQITSSSWSARARGGILSFGSDAA